MTTELGKVIAFRTELESIMMDEIRDFAKNALEITEDAFFEDQELIGYTKKVFKVVDYLLEREHIGGGLRDAILAGVLLADTKLHAEVEGVEAIHPILVRHHLLSLRDDLNPAIWDGIFTIVEQHEKSTSIPKELEAKPGTPAYFVSLAHAIVKADFVSVSL